MDYGALPPEINSGRMYTGPGAGPMLAAALAWDSLGAELHSAAASYAAAIADLTAGMWRGPAAIAMAAAVDPFVSWMSATAAQADEAAARAKIAVGAYESAFAATVPPPVVAANRSLLMSLISTNILGQNTPAIAATEAQYAEMWAQDAVAMYAYAASSSAAAQLAPFGEPPQTTNSSGAALHNLATTIGASPTSGSTSLLQGLALSQVATVSVPAWLAPDLANWNTMMGVLTGPFSFQGWSSIPGGPFLSFGQVYAYAQNGQGVTSFLAPAQPVTGALAPIAQAITPHVSAAGSVGSAASGAMGRAALVGSLSVPQGWTTAAPAIRTVAATLSANLAAAPSATLGGESGVFGQMVLSSLAGRALASATSSSSSGGATVAALGGVVAEADPAAAMIFVLPALEE